MNTAQYLALRELGENIPPSFPINVALPHFRVSVRKELEKPVVEEFLAGLRQGNCSSNALAKRLGRSRGYTRVTLAGMYARGLVTRSEGRIRGILRYFWEAAC